MSSSQAPSNAAKAGAEVNAVGESIILPRVTIQFCTQCKWMLRAAYYAQELLSTFSTSLGEVSLQPSTSGTFIVQLYYLSPTASAGTAPSKHLIWDRKAQNGFPETKELKRLIRDVIQPDRDLGHVDRHSKPKTNASPDSTEQSSANVDGDIKRETRAVNEYGYQPKNTAAKDNAQGQDEKSKDTSSSTYQNPELDQQTDKKSLFETETVMSGVPIPKAVSRLQESGDQNQNQGEGSEQGQGGQRKPPMEADDKVEFIGAEGNVGGACKPGDDCWEG